MKKTLITFSALSLAFGLAACSSESKPEPAGDLSSMSGVEYLDGSGEVTTGVEIGTVAARSGMAVYDAPGGVTIGRLEPGEYPLIKTVDGWLLIGLPTEPPSGAQSGAIATGWIPASAADVHLYGTDQ